MRGRRLSHDKLTHLPVAYAPGRSRGPEALLETVLRTDRVYEGRVIGVRVDRVRFADGTEATREVVDHGGSAAILAVDDADRVLLINQYRYPAAEHLWEIPAGRLEPGEPPNEAAARELAEEAGLAASRLEPLMTIWATPGYCTERLWVYVASGLSPHAGTPDADERITYAWFERGEAVAMCLDGRINDAKTVAAVLAFATQRG